MGHIKVLTEQVASQIAAGEVIERPASIVRELLDNSIDAGSTRITIRIEAGGRHLIRIGDNGAGMGRDDLCLCITRHATSKIQEISDLSSIRTLGFRGEALASIAAVSRLEMTSRPADQLIGHRLKVIGGQFMRLEETGAPPGTLVDVQDLFFNLPARKKFLRSEKTESNYILDTITRQALPFKQIAFKIDLDGKNVLNLPDSPQISNRLATYFNKEFSQAMIEAENTFDRIMIQAYLGPPELARSKGDNLLIYVNKRHVRDKLLTKAIIEGYGQRLMRGQYPQAVLLIEIDPGLVDFNVHPAKQEIRFQQTQFIYQAVLSSVKKALNRHLPVPYAGATETAGSSQPGLSPLAGAQVAEPQPFYSMRPVGTSETPEIKALQADLLKEPLQVLGQLNDTYILCQAQNGLLLIDQHAAHERIVYDKLQRAVQEAKFEKQSFLIPPKFEFSLKESRLIRDKGEQFHKIGLELEYFGGNTFILRSVPSLLTSIDYETFLRELVPLLEEEAGLTREKALDKFLTVMACHGAIRAGKKLSAAEMDVLVRQLDVINLVPHCPHGRPIVRRISIYEIEKMFKRV
jgi:DNA mismatch repair protein MutL